VTTPTTTAVTTPTTTAVTTPTTTAAVTTAATPTAPSTTAVSRSAGSQGEQCGSDNTAKEKSHLHNTIASLKYYRSFTAPRH
jgi:hypothetical protein